MYAADVIEVIEHASDLLHAATAANPHKPPTLFIQLRQFTRRCVLAEEGRKRPQWCGVYPHVVLLTDSSPHNRFKSRWSEMNTEWMLQRVELRHYLDRVRAVLICIVTVIDCILTCPFFISHFPFPLSRSSTTCPSSWRTGWRWTSGSRR
jgi:hypothetical protein